MEYSWYENGEHHAERLVEGETASPSASTTSATATARNTTNTGSSSNNSNKAIASPSRHQDSGEEKQNPEDMATLQEDSEEAALEKRVVNDSIPSPSSLTGSKTASSSPTILLPARAENSRTRVTSGGSTSSGNAMAGAAAESDDNDDVTTASSFLRGDAFADAGSFLLDAQDNSDRILGDEMLGGDDDYDEEEGNDSLDDPLTYSDDSASLSDAYFFPQNSDDDLARPPRYKLEDWRAQQQQNAAAFQQQQQTYPLASYYGALGNNNGTGNGGAWHRNTPPRSVSPYWEGQDVQQQQQQHQQHLLVPSGNAGWSPGHHHHQYGYHYNNNSASSLSLTGSPLWAEGPIQEDVEVQIPPPNASLESNAAYNSFWGHAAHANQSQDERARLLPRGVQPMLRPHDFHGRGYAQSDGHSFPAYGTPASSSSSNSKKGRRKRYPKHARYQNCQRAHPGRAAGGGSVGRGSSGIASPPSPSSPENGRGRMVGRQINRGGGGRRTRQVPLPQDPWRNVFFAVLFILQFLVVTSCAILLGLGVMGSPSEASYHPGSEEAKGPALATTLTHASSNTTVGHSIGFMEPQYVDDDQVSRSTAAPTVAKEFWNGTLLLTNSSNITELKEISVWIFRMDYEDAVALVSTSGGYACIMTSVSFIFMMMLSRSLIPILLVLTMLLTFVAGIVGLYMDPYGIVAIAGFSALLGTLAYTVYNWNGRIPLASINLNTALIALRSTADITLLGVASLFVASCWSILWFMALVGMINYYEIVHRDHVEVCNGHNDVAVECSWNSVRILVYVLLFFSFIWTHTVIKNVSAVTVSSATAAWWFHPEQVGSFCTGVVRRPLIRSCTQSLGSICLASLIVQPAEILLFLGRCFCSTALCNCSCCHYDAAEGNCFFSCCTQPASSSPQRAHEESNGLLKTDSSHKADGPLASPGESLTTNGSAPTESGVGSMCRACRRQCSWIDTCTRSLRSCNRYAFVLIGMYGYGVMDAGGRVLELFQTHSWINAVQDNLVDNMLLVASLMIGLSTGMFALVVAEADGYQFTSLFLFHQQPPMMSFLMGAILGFCVSQILLLGVVASALHTILVCFAAAPYALEKNHPVLSRDMREAWSRHVWERLELVPPPTQ